MSQISPGSDCKAYGTVPAGTQQVPSMLGTRFPRYPGSPGSQLGELPSLHFFFIVLRGKGKNERGDLVDCVFKNKLELPLATAPSVRVDHVRRPALAAV